MENLISGVKGVHAEQRLRLGEGFVEEGTGPFRSVMSVMAAISGSREPNEKVWIKVCNSQSRGANLPPRPSPYSGPQPGRGAHPQAALRLSQGIHLHYVHADLFEGRGSLFPPIGICCRLSD